MDLGEIDICVDREGYTLSALIGSDLVDAYDGLIAIQLSYPDKEAKTVAIGHTGYAELKQAVLP